MKLITTTAQFSFALATIVVMVSLVLTSCEKDHLPDTTIYFQEDVLPLIVSNCSQSGCHNSVDQREGYDLTGYNGILAISEPGNHKGSDLYKVLVRPIGFMPDGGERFSDDQITTIALWIDQGALNNSSGGSNCDTDSVTYSGTVVPLLTGWCLVCHSGNTPIGIIRLDSYNSVKAKVNDGELLGSIRHDPNFRAMPDGGGKLPACDIERIEKWVADGAPNN